MTHYMKLNPIPFMQIRMGMKTIELRLWDEKRSMIKTGDDIIFTCTEDGRSLQASVFKMHRFHDFEALYKALPLEKCGYTAEEAVTASYTDMEAYYTKEQIKSFGVVGIELCNVRVDTMDVIRHYDLLIDEDNDPARDPKPLRDYMNRWDGEEFIEKMELDLNKTVLEIGVGTGRLAMRTAPFCKSFFGIDISPKTIARAKENLAEYTNVTLACGDFLTLSFSEVFDVVYSSLTFMHIVDKQSAVDKAALLLNDGGRLVISIDKSQNKYIDYGSRQIEIYPDSPENILSCINNSGMTLAEKIETEAAYIFVAKK